MTQTQNDRIDDLMSLGLKFNGDSYVGSGDNSDFHFHHTEFMYDDDEVWNDKISKVKAEKRRRTLNKIL